MGVAPHIYALCWLSALPGCIFVYATNSGHRRFQIVRWTAPETGGDSGAEASGLHCAFSAFLPECLRLALPFGMLPLQMKSAQGSRAPGGDLPLCIHDIDTCQVALSL